MACTVLPCFQCDHTAVPVLHYALHSTDCRILRAPGAFRSVPCAAATISAIDSRAPDECYGCGLGTSALTPGVSSRKLASPDTDATPPTQSAFPRLRSWWLCRSIFFFAWTVAPFDFVPLSLTTISLVRIFVLHAALVVFAAPGIRRRRCSYLSVRCSDGALHEIEVQPGSMCLSED